MTNKTLLPGLPDFDDPDLEQKIERLAESDFDICAKLLDLLEDLNWHEKMAVCQTAVFFIDNTHHKLLKLVPVHGELSEPLQRAMQLVEGLSPQALAELAEDILQEDFEGEIEVSNES
jgi:hypothetical protein